MDIPTQYLNYPNGATVFIQSIGLAVKENNNWYKLRNNNTTETLEELPNDKPHNVGNIIFHDDKFYEGVENGQWIRIDNE